MATEATKLRTFGLVVHPKREIDGALDTVRDWAGARDVAVRQVRVDGQKREVADYVDADDCDLILAIGGDGTALAALHAGAKAQRPVLGIACGSIGALTSIHADRLDWALDRVGAGDFHARTLPAIDLGDGRFALNDVAVVRAGGGQVAAAISVDGQLYARLAGDGVIVATPRGSSAYTMAAGGPLLATTCESYVVTPLAPHGGSAPPLVVGGRSAVTIEIDPGYGGARLEIDGQSIADAGRTTLSLAWRADYARLVTLDGEESLLAGLRRRGLVVDSPRAKLREQRDGDI